MRKIAFTITRTREGVFLTQGTPSGNNRTRVADPIRVRSIGTRWSDKVTLVEIRFKTIHGDYRSEMFPFSYLLYNVNGGARSRFGLAIRVTSGRKTGMCRTRTIFPRCLPRRPMIR